jgi:ATP-dependent Clp protease, protease subunit
MSAKTTNLLRPLDPALSHIPDLDLKTLLALQRREVSLYCEIHDDIVDFLTTTMSYLDALSNEPITLNVNSPGGSVYDGLALINTVRSLRSPVRTICTGHAMSMATFVLAAGKKGQRYAYRWTRIMVHQPSDFNFGTTKKDDAKVQAQELEFITQMGVNMYAQFGSQSKEVYQKLMEGVDKYMTPEAYLALGLIDYVIDSPDEIKD